MLPDLSEMSESLKQKITDHGARIRIVVETGYDEAGMVATTSGYLRLAQALLDFVIEAEAQRTETWTVNGLTLPGSGTIGALFGPDEVRINTFMLAATADEGIEIVKHFLRLSPPSGSLTD